MAKSVKKTQPRVVMSNQQFDQFKQTQGVIANEMMTLHREMLNRMLNEQTDIEKACGYPLTLTIQDYKTMYERMGLARRAVQIWPEECWQRYPEIYEKEKPGETEFEKKWKELEVRLALFSYMFRIDVLSGIGSFGVLLLGLDDGKSLDMPVDGIDGKTGLMSNGASEEVNLLFLRAFDESVVNIEKWEEDIKSPRYGLPTMYSIKYQEQGTSSGATFRDYKVHWTRIIHVADNRESSEIYGVSRLQGLYNNLYDIKKVSGGSGEMFWKGGFPGYSFELTPEAAAMGAEIDAESVKEQMLLWSQGLQRWLALTGVTTKSLTPQVADPTGHVEVHLKLVALSLGVPYRVLLGSEEAKLASVQDKRTWNNRVAKRQESYLTRMLVRPFIERLIGFGCLPKPIEIIVNWPDLNAATDDDIAKIALHRTDAFAKYVGGQVDALIPPRQYFTEIHKMSDEEANNILKESAKYESELNTDESDEDDKNGNFNKA